jgi:hypothetical protein
MDYGLNLIARGAVVILDLEGNGFRVKHVRYVLSLKVHVVFVGNRVVTH